MVRGEAVRLKLNEESLESGRAARSVAPAESGRGTGAGAGEVGRLAGRKKEGALRAYIAVRRTEGNGRGYVLL